MKSKKEGPKDRLANQLAQKAWLERLLTGWPQCLLGVVVFSWILPVVHSLRQTTTPM